MIALLDAVQRKALKKDGTWTDNLSETASLCIEYVSRHPITDSQVYTRLPIDGSRILVAFRAANKMFGWDVLDYNPQTAQREIVLGFHCTTEEVAAIFTAGYGVLNVNTNGSISQYNVVVYKFPVIEGV